MDKKNKTIIIKQYIGSTPEDGNYTNKDIDDKLLLKADLVDGKIVQSQLPDYVNDVLDFPSVSQFPVEWESWKIYIDTNTNKLYTRINNLYSEPSLQDLSVYYTKTEVNNLLDDKRDLYTREYLVTNWTSEPALNSTISGGEVYNYTLNWVTRYRFVPTTYNPTQDAFYATFDGTTLSNLIVARW